MMQSSNLLTTEYTRDFNTLDYMIFPWNDFMVNETNETIVGQGEVDEDLWRKIPLGVLLTGLSLLTFIGNAMVLHAVRSERRLQTWFNSVMNQDVLPILNRVNNMYIVSLAVADLIVGIFVMPISTIYIFTKDWLFGVAICQIWIAIDYTASTASILNLFILSVDRYWSVTSPLRYLRKRTKKRAFVMISIVWFISSLWIIPIVGWHHFAYQGVRTVPSNVCDTEYATDSIFKVVTAFFNFYLPLAVMYSLYGKVFHEIRKRSALELGQRYPTSNNPLTYVHEEDQPSEESSCVRPVDTFPNDHHQIKVDESNYYRTKASSYTKRSISNKNHISTHRKRKCIVLKSRNTTRIASKGSNERSRLNPRCRVEYIYDENVLDPKTEKIERFYYQEYIPMTIRPSDIVINPSVCNEPSLSSPSLSSSSEERHSINSKRAGVLQASRRNYSLVNGIRHLRKTEQILDQTVSISKSADKQNGGKSRSVFLFGNDTSRRLSSVFNVKHRINNIRQHSSLTKEIKAARQLGVIMGAFTLCFLPYFTLFLVISFCNGCVSQTLMTAMTWIGYLNSTLNPFLYPLCNMNFRRKFRKMLRINNRRKRRREADFTLERNSFTMRYD